MTPEDEQRPPLCSECEPLMQAHEAAQGAELERLLALEEEIERDYQTFRSLKTEATIAHYEDNAAALIPGS